MAKKREEFSAKRIIKNTREDMKAKQEIRKMKRLEATKKVEETYEEPEKKSA